MDRPGSYSVRNFHIQRSAEPVPVRLSVARRKWRAVATSQTSQSARAGFEAGGEEGFSDDEGASIRSRFPGRVHRPQLRSSFDIGIGILQRSQVAFSGVGLEVEVAPPEPGALMWVELARKALHGCEPISLGDSAVGQAADAREVGSVGGRRRSANQGRP